MRVLEAADIVRGWAETNGVELSDPDLETLAEVAGGMSVADSARQHKLSVSGIKQRRALAYRAVGVADSHALLTGLLDFLA